MPSETNHLGQALGYPVPNWTAPPVPPSEVMEGSHVRLEPLGLEHGAGLWEAFSLDGTGGNWTYLPYGPFEDFESFLCWLQGGIDDPAVLFFAIREQKSRKIVGMIAYLRIAPEAGSIEVGHVHFSPLLQRTPAATEALYLMASNIFRLGYRRYEWKCNSFNEPSRRAAERLGFTYEGTFRQAQVVKGYNRDTAWFSMLDSEWPALEKAYLQWLSLENFDEAGHQRASLKNLIQAVLHE